MNTTELLDDYAIEVAKKILNQQEPNAIYDDIAVVPVGNTPLRDVYFINHPLYYKVRVEAAGFYGTPDDSRSDNRSDEEVGGPLQGV